MYCPLNRLVVLLTYALVFGLPAAAPAQEPDAPKLASPRSALPPWRRAPLGDTTIDRILTLLKDKETIIYGGDDRVELIDVQDPEIRKLAKAVCVMVDKDALTKLPSGGYALHTTTLAQQEFVCADEAFATEPVVQWCCTAFLVQDSVAVTARHCVDHFVDRYHDLSRIRLVFDYALGSDRGLPTSFRAIYSVKAVLHESTLGDSSEWALLRIDGPTGRKPLSIRAGPRIADDTPVCVFGHPKGLPLKFAGGAKVRVNSPADHFWANLDTYGGNSGSPVISVRGYQVEGILVDGGTDFERRGDCFVSRQCPDVGCTGELVSRASLWQPLVGATTSSGLPGTGH
jgi:hypothetical protein